MKKTLIAFFSHAGQNYSDGQYKILSEGNTKRLAKKLSTIIDADLFEIETIKTYPENYKDCCDEALKEQRTNQLPELKNYLPTINEYENIVVMYPCWWGTMPKAVVTFLKHYDFSNKNIYPICTHEGSGMGSSERDLRNLLTTANIKGGLAVRGSNVDNSDSVLRNFVSANNL